MKKTDHVSPASLRDLASAAAEFHRLFGRDQSFGDRLSDKVAAVGGSWGFIIAFSIFLLGWTALNTFVLARHAFDPFPFIFLNLMLSMVAALQAPIIMMSQNARPRRTDWKIGSTMRPMPMPHRRSTTFRRSSTCSSKC